MARQTPGVAFLHRPSGNAGARPECLGRTGAVTGHTGFGHASGHPRRFAGLGAVLLQHVALAVGELERLMGELGLKGVRVNSNIDRMELDDPSLENFYAAAEELGALLFLHPQGFTDAERLGGERRRTAPPL